MTKLDLEAIKTRDIDSLSADAPYNPDVWTLAADRDALVAEVEALRNELERRITEARELRVALSPTNGRLYGHISYLRKQVAHAEAEADAIRAQAGGEK